jgi:hypothetical protein
MTQPENLNAVDCIHQNLLTKRLDQDRPSVDVLLVFKGNFLQMSCSLGLFEL